LIGKFSKIITQPLPVYAVRETQMNFVNISLISMTTRKLNCVFHVFAKGHPMLQMSSIVAVLLGGGI